MQSIKMKISFDTRGLTWRRYIKITINIKYIRKNLVRIPVFTRLNLATVDSDFIKFMTSRSTILNIISAFPVPIRLYFLRPSIFSSRQIWWCNWLTRPVIHRRARGAVTNWWFFKLVIWSIGITTSTWLSCDSCRSGWPDSLSLCLRS